jgi:hypothetical protein
MSGFSTPFGRQAGFVQRLGAFEQDLSFGGGTYVLSFYAAGRIPDASYNGLGADPFTVTIDGQSLAFGLSGSTITPNAGSFGLYTSDPFAVTTGDHALQFSGTILPQDRTSIIDQVSVASVAAPVPSTVWGGLILLSGIGFVRAFRRGPLI